MIQDKRTLKSVFLNNITPFFINKGYTYRWKYIAEFYLKTSKYLVYCYFDFLDNRLSIRGGDVILSLRDVEDIILEIQHPNKDFDSFLNQEDFLITLWSSSLILDEELILNTKEKVLEVTNQIKRYIETEGQKFIDTYSFLPNILVEMDRLRLEGKYWHEILSGGPEYLFRGLIISKLCNDPDFHNKRKYTDSIFYGDPDEWIPYYEKLKTRLETLEPLYSMDSDGIYQPIPQPNLPKATTTEASSNLEIDNKTEIKNSDLTPETVIEIEHFDTVHLEKLTKFLSNIHKHTIEASQARDDDMLNREELLYFQEIHRDQINKAIGDTPIHKAMKLERIEIFPNNTNEFAIYYYALDLGTFTTLAVNVTLSPEGWVEDSRMIVD